MKLLLTSSGFTNQKIIDALADLVIKPFKDLCLAFIPTAANVLSESKDWLIDDLYNCKKLGFKSIDIVDFSAVPRSIWLPRLERADILFFGGGSNYYLMASLIKFGLDKLLPELLKTRVYVGLSAGSSVTSPWWDGKYDHEFYDEADSPPKYKQLGFVGFQIMPHFNLPAFSKLTLENIKKLANEIQDTIYVLDNDSAVKVDGSSVEVVSDGVWHKFN